MTAMKPLKTLPRTRPRQELVPQDLDPNVSALELAALSLQCQPALRRLCTLRCTTRLKPLRASHRERSVLDLQPKARAAVVAEAYLRSFCVISSADRWGRYLPPRGAVRASSIRTEMANRSRASTSIRAACASFQGRDRTSRKHSMRSFS